MMGVNKKFAVHTKNVGVGSLHALIRSFPHLLQVKQFMQKQSLQRFRVMQQKVISFRDKKNNALIIVGEKRERNSVSPAHALERRMK